MYSLYDYSNMFGDEVRLAAYSKALKSVITPTSTVLDLGAGSGLYSLIACKLGAQKVYAIDPSYCIQIGKELAQTNGFADRIEWIQDDSRKVELPEKVDILFHDIRGSLPFVGENLAIISDAQNRFLKKDGHLLPQKDTLHIALAKNQSAFDKAIQPWNSCGEGLDLTPLSKRHAHMWHPCKPKPKQLVSASKIWTTLNYGKLDGSNIDNTITLNCDQDTTVHGFYLWFDAQIVPGVGYSGGPGKKRPTVYGCGFFPWITPVKMKAGDQAQIYLKASLVAEDYIWSWHTSISGSTNTSFKQSTFNSEIIGLSQLRKRAHSHTPQLNQDGTYQTAALQLMNGQRSLESISKELMAKFPRRFPKYNQTLAFVGNLSEKFSL
ncbi:MAG: 50S ribosomal protein L11 methyltransferase [Verrucomicrobiales bacterium]|nr:50S ribosomal protein L11 methyltransferase [Verrucomicrobiales bacterium]